MIVGVGETYQDARRNRGSARLKQDVELGKQ
jgi:hypothetical protein